MEGSGRPEFIGRAPQRAIFRQDYYSPIGSTVALAIWLVGLLLFLAVIPVSYKSSLGRRLAIYICKYACGYFPVTLHVEDINAFDPSKAYVFAYEPHSILPLGIVALCNYTGFMPLPKIKALATNTIFYIPILRHIWTWMGLAAATKKNFISYLSAGYSCIVIPGGVQELMHMEPGLEVAFLRRRQGFVRISMEMGHPLVPVFCFGQTNLYSWWKPKGHLYARLSRVLKFTPLAFWGVSGSPIPRRHPMYVVVGKPIEVEKIVQPTKEEINEVHGKFIAAIQELFESHKAKANQPDLQLRIV